MSINQYPSPISHPFNERILQGVTLQTVFELCSKLGIDVKKNSVTVDRLKNADEMMLLGSPLEVMPVVQVDGWKVGDGKPGEITRQLQQAFRDVTRGKICKF
jgi:D-alanine transaminase